MNVCLVTPSGPGSRSGNRVTALRWARILRGLGHRVTLATRYRGDRCDLLIALHARKSASSIAVFRRRFPRRPLVVALTGTDVYGDLHRSASARRSLRLATAIVALQPLAVRKLSPNLRRKARVVHQSAARTPRRKAERRSGFWVSVVGHLRPVKDPFRTAAAVRGLPKSSKILVRHAGRALSSAMRRRARAEGAKNPRYRWMGELPRWKARRLIASSHLLVLSSRMEGGSHVVSEGCVDGVPILASRIPGTIGLLGSSYPGYFPVGDTRALRRLLLRAETDRKFLGALTRRCATLAPLFDPRRERRSWESLLREIGVQKPISARGAVRTPPKR